MDSSGTNDKQMRAMVALGVVNSYHSYLKFARRSDPFFIVPLSSFVTELTVRFGIGVDEIRRLYSTQHDASWLPRERESGASNAGAAH